MTTQRDRLAAECHRSIGDWHENRYYIDGDEQKNYVIEPCKLMAEALLARGVRVLDVETVASALRVFIWDQFDGDVDEGDRRQAEDFLAVLDRTEADR